jgi:hypothetical protein
MISASKAEMLSTRLRWGLGELPVCQPPRDRRQFVFEVFGQILGDHSFGSVEPPGLPLEQIDDVAVTDFPDERCLG